MPFHQLSILMYFDVEVFFNNFLINFGRQNGQEGWAPATYMMKAEKAHMERVARASGVQIVGKLEDISDLMQEDGDDSWDDEPDPPPRPSKPYLSIKSRSLERGGSIRPPPRQNSIKNVGQVKQVKV